MTPKDRLDSAISAIRSDLAAGAAGCAQRRRQVAGGPAAGAAHQLYDLEMLGRGGLCNGVENCARHLAGRVAAGPFCKFFNRLFPGRLAADRGGDATSPVRSCRRCTTFDQARKKVLIEHGFRLPSAADNRPLKIGRVLGERRARPCSSQPPRGLRVVSELVAEQVIQSPQRCSIRI